MLPLQTCQDATEREFRYQRLGCHQPLDEQYGVQLNRQQPALWQGQTRNQQGIHWHRPDLWPPDGLAPMRPADLMCLPCQAVWQLPGS